MLYILEHWKAFQQKTLWFILHLAHGAILLVFIHIDIFLYIAYTLDYQSPFDKGSLVLSPGWSCGAISLV